MQDVLNQEKNLKLSKSNTAILIQTQQKRKINDYFVQRKNPPQTTNQRFVSFFAVFLIQY